MEWCHRVGFCQPRESPLCCLCLARLASASALLFTDGDVKAMFCHMFTLQHGTVPVVLHVDVPERGCFRPPAPPWQPSTVVPDLENQEKCRTCCLIIY